MLRPAPSTPWASRVAADHVVIVGAAGHVPAGTAVEPVGGTVAQHALANQDITAAAGQLGFTSIRAGFLVAGNHFAERFCHEWAQNTYFQVPLWAIGTMIFPTLG